MTSDRNSRTNTRNPSPTTTARNSG
jgi:hypothetical protein